MNKDYWIYGGLFLLALFIVTGLLTGALIQAVVAGTFMVIHVITTDS